MPYYGVRVGKVPGVYKSWSECREQIHKYPGAKHKRFSNPFSAQRFVAGDDGLPKMKQLTLDNKTNDQGKWSDARKRCWAFQQSIECNNDEDSYERRMTHAFGH